MRQELNLRQRPVIHGELSRSLELLRVPAPELERMMRVALQQNLLLETEEPEADAAPAGRPDTTHTGEADSEEAFAGEAGMGPSYADREDYAARPPGGDAGPRPVRDGDLQEPRDPGQRPLVLDLNEQLALSPGASGLRGLCELIVASLDEEGYLMDSLDDIIALARRRYTLAQARAALALIQSLDPAGVGARDLGECLRLQLRRLPEDAPGRGLALRIARGQLPLLAAGNHAALARRLRAPQAQLRQALARIRECNPRPGRTLAADPEQPLVPDLLLTRGGDGEWHVELNEEASLAPRLRVNATYAGAVGSEHPDLKAQLQEARWLLRALEMRRGTLLRVGAEIVRRQTRWLSEGDEAMAPLTMRAAAEALGVHETTVSRAVAGKYMQTPHGVVALRQFFSAALPGEDGARSANAVRARIRHIIGGESPAGPLSDQALVHQLAGEGIHVARRTVAKYREEMRIPPSFMRRSAS